MYMHKNKQKINEEYTKIIVNFLIIEFQKDLLRSIKSKYCRHGFNLFSVILSLIY